MGSDTDVDFDVLILGGGFAGVYCAKVLGRYARRNAGFRVGLVAAENHMLFQPMLPEVASASLSPRHVVSPIRQLCKGTDVFRGEVRSIDAAEKVVHLKAGDFTPDVLFRFKHLVVCLGAKTDLSRVPGMTEHSLPMQRVGDAMKLRATVISRFEEANLVRDRDRRRQLLSFVVVGGGYSGVETAGELFDLMIQMHAWYENVDREDFSVKLVHSKEHLLPTLSRRLGDYTKRKLAESGVELVLGQRVRSVTAKRVLLDNGAAIESNTVISTIGTAPHPLVLQLATDLGLETTRGRLSARQNGRVADVDWLWTAGDCSAIPMDSGELSPPTAQFAQRQGQLVGRNIVALYRQQPLRDFKFTGLGELAAIGHRRAVAEIFGMQFSGFIAWWMWRSIYLSKLPGFQKKLRVMLDWTFDLFFPRDINLLTPQYTRPLKEVFLEPGDILFNPGEPAFSLYFVKRGSVDIIDGDRLIKSVFAGEYFGERALLDDEFWHFRGVAREPSLLVALGAREFHSLVQGSDALKRLFTRSAQAYLSSEDTNALRKQLHPEMLSLTAAELMNRNVDTLSDQTSIADALKVLKSKRHGSYPVIGPDGRVRGSVKRDDVYDYVKAYRPGSRGVVADLPLTNLAAVSEEATASELIEVILRSGRNKIHVTGSDGALRGLITVADLIEHAGRYRQQSADSLGSGSGEGIRPPPADAPPP